jgi:hypothetical protein
MILLANKHYVCLTNAAISMLIIHINYLVFLENE